MAIEDIAQEANHAFKATQVMAYNALAWYFSWYYWAAGIAYGLSSGLFYAVTQYYSTLFQDAMLVLHGKRPTAGLTTTPTVSAITTTTVTAPVPRNIAPAGPPFKPSTIAPNMKVSPPTTMPATALPAY
ncbi:hypothetical protein V8C86DRAFT_3033120 [Haematococcus lacustris]